MTKTTRRSLATLLAIAPTLVAWRPFGESLTLAPQSKLWVEGTSTVRKFSCSAPAFTVDVDGSANAIGGVLAGEKAVKSVIVKVPAAKLDCGNGKMNEHMMKAIRGEDAPMIEYRLTSYSVTKGSAGVQGTLDGTLALGGQTRPIAVAAQAADAGNGSLRITGSYELSMKDFGLKPPSLMMGTMKVGDIVTVKFDLVLKHSAVAALSSGN